MPENKRQWNVSLSHYAQTFDLPRIRAWYDKIDKDLSLKVVRLIRNEYLKLKTTADQHRRVEDPDFENRDVREKFAPFGKGGFMIRYEILDHDNVSVLTI